MRIKIGDLLVKAGVITDLQLRAALAEQQQWGGKLGDILVRMEFLTEEILVRALSKQTGIPRADLTGDPDRASLALIPAEVAEEFGLVPIGLRDEGRTIVVAMSDPLNIGVTDHLRSLTGAKKIDSQLAGASAIRNAISRWYRGEELLGDDAEASAMKVVNNSGQSVVTLDPRKKNAASSATASAPPASTGNGAPRQSAVEVLRGVEETQRRSVAALKAMVELLIEKGVFSRDEYLARVKR
ncbi:MAG: general secretion pathway protein GspE [Myxococcales bacterium]|nr:general secretion pathway protein GspE [Myxococcales bacterium]